MCARENAVGKRGIRRGVNICRLRGDRHLDWAISYSKITTSANLHQLEVDVHNVFVGTADAAAGCDFERCNLLSAWYAKVDDFPFGSNCFLRLSKLGDCTLEIVKLASCNPDQLCSGRNTKILCAACVLLSSKCPYAFC